MNVSEIMKASRWAPDLRPARPGTPKTLAAKAYECIRADIVAGRLLPDFRLLTEEIKQRYDIGGSPMREALSRLAADGLLRNEGHKGFRVVSTSVGELMDLGRTRLHLELQALAAAIRQGDVDWEVGILSQFHRLQRAVEQYSKDPQTYADEWEQTHRAFHFALMVGCQSPWLLHFCDRIYDQAERYRRLYTDYKQIPKALISSHEDIMRAVIARDMEISLDLAKDHIIFATRQTVNDMMKAGIETNPDEEAAIGALESNIDELLRVRVGLV